VNCDREYEQKLVASLGNCETNRGAVVSSRSLHCVDEFFDKRSHIYLQIISRLARARYSFVTPGPLASSFSEIYSNSSTFEGYSVQLASILGLFDSFKS
jgi:hypothetical protein